MKDDSWAPSNRRDQQDQIDEREHDQGDDQQRRDQPIDAEALETVGQRREQIGDRQAGDEGQQYFAQQPQQPGRTRQARTNQNNIWRWTRMRSSAAFRGVDAMARAAHGLAAVGIHVAHPFGHIGGDRQQRQRRDQAHQYA